MNKIILLITAILLIWTSQAITNCQMRNADNINIEDMQRYVEYINATGQLNSYNRR